jgi:hypothetical protein
MTPEGGKRGSRDEAREAREAVDWIMGRLTVLEYLILFLAMGLALLGGALVAWLLDAALPLSFRWLWALASLLLFILPAGFVYLREFRRRDPLGDRDPESETKEADG